MTQEKRRRTRAHCRVEAVVETAGGAWKGACRDISLHGVYVRVAAGDVHGVRCRVEIILKGSTSQVALSMRGRIVRVDAGGIAVAFEHMDVETSWHLRNIVVVCSEDPARARAELGV